MVNRTEAALLLGIVASFDRRTVADEDAIAWAAALPEVDFGQARDAVVAHYRETREWIMPADVLRRVRQVRRTNLVNIPAVTPPSVLADDPTREQEWVRLYRWRIGAGDTAEAAVDYACGRMGVPMDTGPAVEAPDHIRAVLAAANTKAVE